MSDLTNDRKIEHIQAIEKDPQTDRSGHYFDRIRLSHRALPELNLGDIDTGCDFLGYRLSFPMLISSMTGGDHELIKRINRNLAEAAERCNVAMAVGSQRVMFTTPEAKESFRLREFAPSVPLIGNLGAVQLNYGIEKAQAEAAISVLEADALYLHLNPLQEAVQPEGDTDFSGLAEKIKKLASELDVPVLLKEVGSGLSPADIELGLQSGIKCFDVAGSGGTSWSRIEHHRRKDSSDLGLKFQDWGLPTPLALKMAEPYLSSATIVASGGLRDGIDMVKSVILGASLCGMAAPLLKPAMESADAVVAEIEKIKTEFRTAMFLLGVPDMRTLYNNHALIVEEC
ncbi:type 2 isopentenyl-diphosphate Delta-isomerase [Neptuniibacter caesariensis]|uniref:Isopentenyl-diphosphate delta-isomerase n=1 Tax=Neptuniibacter caesariensis TaxID=207954 RepID=A0A7U8C2G8_NEPCE|nr:type 2 isopentenyl-diphosphate Delta-isomerase [Neptuniibacter caesariensis]EAR60273.1 Isopentenyl-diphosphate delta-isomerase, FMN-dependent [Oceanospirillum sp. MED92] [Neptuniibacter caesariensis]